MEVNPIQLIGRRYPELLDIEPNIFWQSIGKIDQGCV